MDNKKFDYTYSAPTAEEKKEIEYIRKQYEKKQIAENEGDKIRQLKRLHSRANAPATAISISIGIAGTLIFGLGLTMTLEWNLLIWGSLVAAVGLIPIISAYKIYNLILNKGKEKYGAKILALSEELLGEKESDKVKEIDESDSSEQG